MSTKKEWPITAYGRRFSDDEARLFNHAVSLVTRHGRQEAMFAAGRGVGEIANADVGPFRIERMVLADGWDKTVQVGIAFDGKTVMRASYEQWKRPRKRSQLSLTTEVPIFERGAWEQAFLTLPVAERAD